MDRRRTGGRSRRAQEWPLRVLTPDVSAGGIEQALPEGPYGECVYDGHNDVVDQQVVNLEFASGSTASFTAAAFTPMECRKTRIFGSLGQLEGDGTTLVLHDFLTGRSEEVPFGVEGGASAAEGHGGADQELIRSFVATLAHGDRDPTGSDAAASLATHRIVWAAEQARHSGAVVSLG